MSSSTTYDDLYQACQTGDFATVKRLLLFLSFEELHHRVESIQHFGIVPSLPAAAWSSKDDRIAQYLVDHGVKRSMNQKYLLSTDGQRQESSQGNQNISGQSSQVGSCRPEIIPAGFFRKLPES